MKLKFRFIAFLFLIIGCKNESIKMNDILKNIEVGTDSTYKREHFPNPAKSLYSTSTTYYTSTIKTFVYYYDIDKINVREIKTYLLNKKYGHYFEFYPNGNLKQYCFYLGNDNNTRYLKKYSSSGVITEDRGDPFVDYLKVEDKKLELHFSSVFCDSILVDVSSKSMPWTKMTLKESTIMPMLFQGEIKSMELNTYFLRITAISNAAKDRRIYIDTLNVAQ